MLQLAHPLVVLLPMVRLDNNPWQLVHPRHHQGRPCLGHLVRPALAKAWQVVVVVVVVVVAWAPPAPWANQIQPWQAAAPWVARPWAHQAAR